MIEQQTEKIRGLMPKRPVKAEFPSTAVFGRVLDGAMREGNPASEIAISQREAVTLGLLTPRDNLSALLFRNLTDQIVGFYDYNTAVLYVRSTPDTFGANRYDIAHEFTHALQDQHYGLQRLLPDQTPLKVRNSDAANAHHALTEGDAVNTQTIFIYRTYSQAQLRALINLQNHLPPMRPLPSSLQREFDFPYTAGTTFVQTLYRQGGMHAVDDAYRRLPSSTYEIMYPAKYLAHWKPTPIRMTGVAGMSGWVQVDDDVFGALGYKLLLWQYLRESTASAVVAGYRGDRYLFLENGTQNALLLKSVWQSAAAAKMAYVGLGKELRTRYPAGHFASGVFTDKDGAVYLHRSGAHITMAYGPSADVALKLGQASVTTSSPPGGRSSSISSRRSK